MWGFHRPSGADAADKAGGRSRLGVSLAHGGALGVALPKIIAAALLGALLGLGAQALLRPSYTASAEILIDAKTPAAPGAAVDGVESQMAVIASTPVLARALQSLEGKALATNDAFGLLVLRRNVFVTRANSAPMVAVVAKASATALAARRVRRCSAP